VDLSPEHASAAADVSRFAGATKILARAIVDRVTPAAALCVTLGGEVTFSTSAGRLTYDADAPPVKSDTVFDVASLTKVLATTSMAMLLYERGKLQLEQPVGEVVSEFLSSDPARNRITFRRLLTHSSGLPAYARLFEEVASPEALLERCLTIPLEAEPGTSVEYSDVGFIILGEALQRLAGESLDGFCHREVFLPLGMSSTCFRPAKPIREKIPPTENDTAFRKRVIQGEVNDENAWVLGGVAGHAGLFAAATDVARFALCLLRGGAPVFKAETVKLFTHRQDEPEGSSRTLGWDTPSAPSQSGKHFSASSFGHLGFTGTSLWIDPEKDVSITLLTNRTWPDRKSEGIRALRPAIHDAIMEALDTE
jgi:serine-type D-Ala-D-Ala carboxypeptidase